MNTGTNAANVNLIKSNYFFTWYFLCARHHEIYKNKMASVLHRLPVQPETQISA